ncbi:nitroreductase [Shimia biformata]|uniref:nitroreductase n=1 Tax=Shimia biformata TaxID=1294299 RepID=UPI00194F6B14|nr:nitroreductase [Shimia biformata]
MSNSDDTAQETLRGLLHARHSCRAFRPDPVPRAVVEQILEDACRAPSWCNAQPWQVVVTSGDETEAFRQAMLNAFDTGHPNPDFPFPTGYSGPYKERRFTCGMQLYEAVGIERGDKDGRVRQMRENYRFFGAPHVAMISTARELGPYGALDCGGFITAFCLAAQAQGIATVPQAAIAFYSDVVREHFDLGDDRMVLCAISFGYADDTHPANQFRTSRATLSQVVDWRD